jgi:cysteine desulfurase
MRVFLDHNAGSPLRPEAVAAIVEFSRSRHGNPASVHRSGQSARKLLEESRRCVADLIGASPREIVFTSGGTESNNLAIEGAIRRAGARRRIITSSIEHSSLLAPLMSLEGRGFEVVKVAPDREGRVPSETVEALIDESVALVTLGLVNAETGVIQDVSSAGRRANEAGAFFHLDAAQALGRIPIDAASIGCDLMTLSGHKIGAPSGIGVLFVRESCAIAPVMLGGPQEGGLRAGTQNLLGAAAFGAAARAVSATMAEETARIAAMTEALLQGLERSIPGLALNGPRHGRVCNTINLSFPGVLGESMLIALDLEGIEVSMGSACAAGAVEPSHVLVAMGRSEAEARSSLRLSLGWSTRPEEIARALEVIARVWRRVADAEPVVAEALR